MLVNFSLILTLVCQGNPCSWLSGSINTLSSSIQTAAVALSFRAFASHGEVWMYESATGLHSQTIGNRCECYGFSDMTIINGCPVPQ